MDKRVLVVLALAASVLAALLVFTLMPKTTVVTPSKPMPEVRVAGSTATVGGAEPGEAPAEAPPPVPGHRSKISASEAEQVVELPAGARVEDGGLAFGDAVCKHITSCGCQSRTPTGCANAYSSFTAENFDTVKCLIDLPCPEMCEALANPGKTTSTCARAVNEITASRFRNKGK